MCGERESRGEVLEGFHGVEPIARLVAEHEVAAAANLPVGDGAFAAPVDDRRRGPCSDRGSVQIQFAHSVRQDLDLVRSGLQRLLKCLFHYFDEVKFTPERGFQQRLFRCVKKHGGILVAPIQSFDRSGSIAKQDPHIAGQASRGRGEREQVQGDRHFKDTPFAVLNHLSKHHVGILIGELRRPFCKTNPITDIGDVVERNAPAGGGDFAGMAFARGALLILNRPDLPVHLADQDTLVARLWMRVCVPGGGQHEVQRTAGFKHSLPGIRTGVGQEIPVKSLPCHVKVPFCNPKRRGCAVIDRQPVRSHPVR